MVGLFRRSSNHTFLVKLHSAGFAEGLAVYKPARGESPLWDFPANTLYLREVAAYRLSRLLGWPRVPPTVVRERAPLGPGSLQAFVTAVNELHYLDLDDHPVECWGPVSVFDVITNNADRKSGHCLFEANGSFWLIDHGLTFNTAPKLRTVIWDFAGESLPQRLAPDLRRVAGLLRSRPGEVFGDLLEPEEVTALVERIDWVLEPGWRFPHPTSAWSVPWPPV